MKKATFGLEANGISDVVTVRSAQGATSYYIVKLVAKSEKSSKWQDYKEKLKQAILTEKQNNTSFIQSVVAKELQAANIKVKDAAFQNLFSQYIHTDGSSTSESSSSKSK